MATFKIIGSRRCGLENSEFDVILESGEISLQEMFSIEEEGTLWDYIILAIEQQANCITLGCVTWIPCDGAFVGSKVKTRALKSVDRKRYASLLPD